MKILSRFVAYLYFIMVIIVIILSMPVILFKSHNKRKGKV